MDSENVHSSEVAVTPSSKKKHWEYAWTVEEMRKAAQHWNLASDVGMLLHLQEFSQKLLSQTHEIQEQVDSLNHDAKLTKIRLHNVFNDFVMLANTQFVENRVYDEEVVGQEPTDGNKKLEEKEKTQEQKELELVPKIKLAISLGLNVFDTAYEKLDMNIANSESEDEDTPNRANIYLEPKDPYLHRPLPCLIGSDQFFQMDNLGLGNLLVDEMDEQESDQMLDGEVAGPSVPQPPALPERKFESISDESDEDLFGESKAKGDTQNNANEEDDDEGEKVFKDDNANAPKNPLTDLHSELTRKLGDSSSSAFPPPKRQGSVDKEGTPSTKPRGSKTRPQHVEGNDDLFGGIPDDPADDIFSRPSLFTSRPTLFDDDNEEESGGLFGSKKSQPKEDNLLSASAANKPVPAEPESRLSSALQSGRKEIREEKQNKGKGLFHDEDDDDESDLFAKKPTAAARRTKEPKKPAVSLFDEDEDESDIFSNENKSSLPATNKPPEGENKRRIPAGAVSIFGGGDNLFKAAVKKAKDGDDDMNDVTGRSTISEKSLSKPSTVVKSLKPTPGSSSPSTVSNSSLFAEDPELFTTVNKSKSSTADLSKDSSQPKAKTGFSLFADDDDDDLFAALSTPSTGNKTAAKEPEAKKKAKNFLFEDDNDDGDDGDLFALPKSSTANDGKKNITVVEEVAPQKSSFEPKPAPAKEPTKEPTKELTKPSKTKVSLFSSSDDEDDLFSLRKSPPKTKVTTDKPPTEGGLLKSSVKGRSLFDDDDFLFNPPDDEGPSVDLFKPPVSKVESRRPSNVVTSSASSEAKSVPIQKPAPSAAPRAISTSLDDDDDDDDLFATLTTKSSDKSKVSSKPAADKAPSVKATTESSMFGVNERPKNSLEDIFENKATKKEKPVAEVKESKASVVKSFEDPLGFETAAIKSEPKMPDAGRASASPILGPLGPSDDDLFSDSKGSNISNAKKEQSPPPQFSTSPKVLPKAPAKGNRISNLQAAINIDPTSHLPPKIKKSEPEKPDSVAVDFSLPAQTPTLHSLAKDRAKIPIKRRPPTRKHAVQQDGEAHNGFGIGTDEKDSIFGYESNAGVAKTQAAVKGPAVDDLSSSAKSPPVSGMRGDDAVQPKSTLFEDKEAVDGNSNKAVDGKSNKAVDGKSNKAVDGKSNKDVPVSMTGSGKTTPAASGKELVSLPPLADEDDEQEDLFGAGLKSKQTVTSASTASTSAANEFGKTGGNSELLTTKANPPDVKSGVKADERIETGTTAALSSGKFNTPDDGIFASKPGKTASANHLTFDIKRGTAAAADDDDDDLFGGKGLLSSSARTATSRIKREDATATQSSENPKPPALTPSKKDDEHDDLFRTKASIKSSPSSVPEKAAVVATSKELTSKRPGEILLSSDDDDIFNVPKNVPSSSTVNAKAVSAVTVAEDDDDDIFANSSLAPKGAHKAAANKPKVKEPVFDDDDDIFASLPSSKVKKPISQPQPKKEVAADKDDLFAAASSSSRPAQKKLARKDEDLFHDDTDIFADIPNAKAREKKPQGRNVKPTGASLFASEPDDIFAEAATATKSTKVTTDARKPVSVTKPKEDYDDIFEDPLNVLRK